MSLQPIARALRRAATDLAVWRPLNSFVGRGDDVDRVARALPETRLVTITGIGGVGKTRLAMEALARAAPAYADGAVVVELAAVRDADDVAPAVVEALGLTPSGEAPLVQLDNFLRDAETLLMLDNCEHLLPAVRPLVRGLLLTAPGLRVLITSRESLGIGGERVVTLRPLAVPDAERAGGLTVDTARRYDAIRLFEHRTAAVNDGFALDPGNVAAVAAICARLDGLPLAIEIAASRLRSVSPAELLIALDDRFRVLVRGDPTKHAHQQTLDGMVRWSWDLCSPGEQRLWARFSVFAGGADLAAVRAVHDGDVGSLVDVVDGLVGKSVLTVEAGGGGAGGTRYSMPETLTAFGRDRLAEAGDTGRVGDLHARYFRDLAARGCRGFLSAEQAAWSRLLRRERANLAVALEYLLTAHVDAGQAAVALAADLRFHWLTSSTWAGVRSIARAAAAAPDPSPDRVVALAFGALLRVATADLPGAAAWAAWARGGAELLDDPVLIRRATLIEAAVRVLGGLTSPDGPEFAEALAATDDEADRAWLFVPLAGQALCLVRAGEIARSRDDVTLIRRYSDEVGESYFHSLADTVAAVAAWTSGDSDGAEAAARRAVSIHWQFPDLRVGMASTLCVLAGVAAERRDDARAARLFGAAAAAQRRAGTRGANWGPAYAARVAEARAGVLLRLGPDREATAAREGAFANRDALRDLALDAARSPPTVSARDGPDTGPLTAREYEVATMVAQGLSNRRIAERLVLSPRTIDGHLERILAKLEFHSRAAVAAWIASRTV